jgi:hypothetical protein
MGLMRVRGLLVGVFGVVCAVLVLGVGSALAAQTRNLVGTFGSLSEPQGVAVAQSSGDVYVADAGNNRVEKFDPLGDLLLAFGADVGGVGVSTCTSLCGAGTRGSAPGEFTFASFVAVDGSGGASAGDVYVGDTGDGLVSKFDSAGNLVAAWGSGGQLNGSTTGAGSFGSLAGVAVGAGGTLYVLNTSSQLFAFAQDGSFTGELTLVRGTSQSGLVVDAAGDSFKANGDASIERSNPAGGDVGTVTGGFKRSFAVEPVSGELYVLGEAALEHYAFNGLGEVLEPGGSTCVPAPFGGCGASDSVAIGFVGSGIAVSSASGDVYVSNASAGRVYVYAPVTIPDVRTGSATEVAPTGVRLNGKVNPDGIQLSDCHFAYVDANGYNVAAADPYSAGQSVPCVPGAASIPADSIEHAVSAAIAGLQPGTTYHFRLVASNVNGSSFAQDVTFETPPPPSINSEVARNVTGASADLTAKINPHGADTHYRFQWGASVGYGTTVPVPDGDIGAGSSDVSVGARLSGLSANTTYHWRVIAQNPSGTSISGDHTFVYATTGGGLPDGRAYEMVTPPHKNGALIGDVFIGAMPLVSGDGSRVFATSIQCFAGAVSCNAERGQLEGSSFAFSRTAGGWAASSLAPPATRFPVSSLDGFSADAGTELLHMPTPPGGDDWYARGADGSLVDIGPVAPPAAGPEGGVSSVRRSAATSDLSHVVWEAATSRSLFWSFDTTQGQNSLYEYVGVGGSQPVLVGVSGGRGSTTLVSTCETVLGSYGGQVAGALSGDGRTVFFTALRFTATDLPCVGPAADGVYARVDESRTVAVSGRSAGDCTGVCQSSPAGDASFMGASVDGSRVFFTSTQQLTDGASEDSHVGDSARGFQGCREASGVNGCNLYEYDFGNPAGHELVDVSAGDLSGGGPRVQGVMAFAPDGSHVYFVAKGVLSGAANAQGQRARDGANNLYVFERDRSFPAGRVVFISSLLDSDYGEWIGGGGGGKANVTPDGRFLVFLSGGRLTGDDVSVGVARQVFRYDAQTGQLVRVSVGEEGFNDNGNRSTASTCEGAGLCSEEASIVGALQGSVGFPRSDPSMSDDGSYVFFRSPVGLTRGALDDVQIGVTGFPGFESPALAQNVYEWHAGHVYLISDGRDVSFNQGQSGTCAGGSSVCLLGADRSGANVFFATADPLVAQDTDTEVDYYDARICTSGDPCVSSPPVGVACQGEACHGTPGSAPMAPGAGTVAFSGPGNLASPSTAVVHKKPTGKKKRKRRVKRRHRRGGSHVKTRAKHAGVGRVGRGVRGGRS